MKDRLIIRAGRAGFLRCILAGSAFSSGAAVRAVERPNVLFLAVDDWNDMVGAMGCPQAVTPNLDRLAARGTVFLNAHAPGVYCAPSRTAIMTGLQPYHSGCYADEPHMYNRPDHKAIPQYFSENGYFVAGGGKIYHHMPGYLGRRVDEWFLWNDEMKKKGWRVGSWEEGTPLPPEVPFGNIAKYTGWEEFDFYAMPDEDEEKMADTLCAEWAASFLKRDHSKPFFLAVGMYAPHKPNYVPKKHFDLYPLDTIRIPETKADDLADLPAGARRAREGRAKRVHDKIAENGDWPRAVQGYLAARYSPGSEDGCDGRADRYLQDPDWSMRTLFQSGIGRRKPASVVP